MGRVILFALLLVGVVYLILWIKSRWDRLPPARQKAVMQLGRLYLFRILLRRWHLLVPVFRRLLKL